MHRLLAAVSLSQGSITCQIETSTATTSALLNSFAFNNKRIISAGVLLEMATGMVVASQNNALHVTLTDATLPVSQLDLMRPQSISVSSIRGQISVEATAPSKKTLFVCSTKYLSIDTTRSSSRVQMRQPAALQCTSNATARILTVPVVRDNYEAAILTEVDVVDNDGFIVHPGAHIAGVIVANTLVQTNSVPRVVVAFKCYVLPLNSANSAIMSVWASADSAGRSHKTADQSSIITAAQVR